MFSSSRYGFKDEAPLFDDPSQLCGEIFVMRADGGNVIDLPSPPAVIGSACCTEFRDGPRKLQIQGDSSEARIDRLALEGENAENAFVNAPERFSLDEALETFDPQRELPQGQRPLSRKPALTQPFEVLR